MSEPHPETHVIAVVGPTASGKSALADALANAIGGEIVCADSMQVYSHMDIGTSKTPAAERSVAYHCFDLVEPGEPYSAALYQRDARRAIEEIAARGARPVLVGGTGLYIRAAVDEMDFPPGETSSERRSRLEQELAQVGPYALHERLVLLDPASAALIHPNNARRVVRALEMLEGEGASYASQAAGFSARTAFYQTTFIGLTMDRELLYERIEARVDRMIAEGLLDEVQRLLDAGYRGALTAAQAIGYKELIPVLEEGASLRAATDRIKRSTRRYAKRQLTWFRADPRVHWIDVTNLSPGETLNAAVALLESGE